MGVKEHKSPLALVDPDPLDQSALSLGELLSWVGGDPYLSELIQTLIMKKTFTTPEIVAAAADSICIQFSFWFSVLL